jgi:hypothetical protein
MPQNENRLDRRDLLAKGFLGLGALLGGTLLVKEEEPSFVVHGQIFHGPVTIHTTKTVLVSHCVFQGDGSKPMLSVNNPKEAKSEIIRNAFWDNRSVYDKI